MRVLAIDPSSTELGWAVLDSKAGDGLVAVGVCKTDKYHYEQRLPFMVQTLNQVLGTYKPDGVVCEEAVRFKGKSIPALQGVTTCIKHWAKRQKLPLAFYNPSTWKASVIGHGGATKEQVARVMCLMFRGQLNINTPEHVTDAVAIGLHALGVSKWEILGLIEK